MFTLNIHCNHEKVGDFNAKIEETCLDKFLFDSFFHPVFFDFWKWVFNISEGVWSICFFPMTDMRLFNA